MASNKSKRPRLGLGLGLHIGPFGTCATLGLNLYMLPHEVVRRRHLRPFRYYFGITCKDRLVTPSQLKPTPILCTLAHLVYLNRSHTLAADMSLASNTSLLVREREGGREGGRERGREGGRKGGREGGVSEGGRSECGRGGGRERGREEGRGGGREGGNEGGREGDREGGREGGKEGGREGDREGGKEGGGRERGRE